jgi:hypothetical protein
MFALLSKRLPPRAAEWLTALWYAVLLLLVLYCAAEPQAEFTYLRL